VLAAATVMIGPQASLYDLTPSANSLGLVKNVQCSQTPTFVDLTQGAKNTRVASVLTNNVSKINFEVFEYTASNLAYGLGLEGYGINSPTSLGPFLTATSLTGSTVTPVTTLTFSFTSDVSAQFPINSWVSIQELNGLNDHVHSVQLTAAATVTGAGPYIITLNFANQGLKLGNNFPAGSAVYPVVNLALGTKVEQPYHSCKITAVLPGNSMPMTMLFPKVKIIKGFSVSFDSSTFGNMPFEFEPFELMSSDPFYSTFLGQGCGALLSST
jgi:hypothetical protein